MTPEQQKIADKLISVGSCERCKTPKNWDGLIEAKLWNPGHLYCKGCYSQAMIEFYTKEREVKPNAKPSPHNHVKNRKSNAKTRQL